MVNHGGTEPGYRSDMFWLPEHDVGAAILTNADSGTGLRYPFRRRVLELLFDGNAWLDDIVVSRRGAQVWFDVGRWETKVATQDAGGIHPA